MMQKHFTARDLRRWAGQCASQANDPNMSGADRERLVKMNKALLDLADAEDWLNGDATMIEFILPDEETAAKSA